MGLWKLCSSCDYGRLTVHTRAAQSDDLMYPFSFSKAISLCVLAASQTSRCKEEKERAGELFSAYSENEMLPQELLVDHVSKNQQLPHCMLTHIETG